MALTIHTYPDPILSTPCQPIETVTDEVRQLSREMVELMTDSQGVGLAAPQVGHSVRLFVVDIWWPNTGRNDKALTFINPVLTFGEDTWRHQEGCLSLPGVYEYVTRSWYVRVNALDAHGKAFELNAEGFLATAIQHEYDHLEGRVMLDRMSTLERRMAKKKLLT